MGAELELILFWAVLITMKLVWLSIRWKLVNIILSWFCVALHQSSQHSHSLWLVNFACVALHFCDSVVHYLFLYLLFRLAMSFAKHGWNLVKPKLAFNYCYALLRMYLLPSGYRSYYPHLDLHANCSVSLYPDVHRIFSSTLPLKVTIHPLMPVYALENKLIHNILLLHSWLWVNP